MTKAARGPAFAAFALLLAGACAELRQQARAPAGAGTRRGGTVSRDLPAGADAVPGGPLAEALGRGREALAAGERVRARAAYGEALALAEAAGDRAVQARAQAGLGDSCDPLRENAAALAHYEKSAALAEGADRDLAQARIHYVTGVGLRAEYRWAEAQQHLEQGVALAQAAGDRHLETRLQIALGHVFMLQGLWDPAEVRYQAALRLLDPEKPSTGLVIATESLGDVASGRGDTSRAAQLYERAVALARRLDNPNLLAEALTSLAGVHIDWADYARAHALLEQALAARSAHPDQIASVYNDLGLVAQLQGEADLAAGHYRRAHAMAEEIGDRYLAARVLSNQAVLAQEQGDLAGALDNARRAIALAEEVGDREALVSHWQIAGSLHEEQGQLAEARAAYERSLELARAVDSKSQVSEGLESLAGLALARGDGATALALADEAAALAAETGGREAFWRCRTLAGRALAAAGRLPEARAAFSEAVQKIEAVRRDLSGGLQVRRFFRSRLVPYQELMQLEIGAGDARAALRLSEAGKARLLLDFLNQSRAAPEAAAAIPPVLEPPPAGLAPVVGADTLVLVYAVLDERTWLFQLAPGEASGEAVLRVVEIPMGRAKLAGAVEDLRRRLARRDLGFAAAARQLYGLLLAPAEAELRRLHRLVLVPDGPLWNLPFQALEDGAGRPLLERHALSYAPSLAVLTRLAGRPPSPPFAAGALLAVGNPAPAGGGLAALPEAEDEVRALGRLYRAPTDQVWIGNAASEARVKARARSYPILHFATHGVLEDRHPLYSHLLLAPSAGSAEEDGLLEVWEILRLHLEAELVILSACQTARGTLGEGEGLIGLTWAFLAAGSRSVVASQWEVDSAATRELMVEFHRRLVAGKPKAEALQGAARALAAEPRYRHPFYWAGFVLVGDGGR